PDEIDMILNRCRFGDFKLLYVSPERLTTVKFKDAIKRIKINLIAVDEAHCISQWGYDFRPPYLQIAAIRPLLPNVPILALTATAIPEVVEDIQEKLEFKKRNLFSKSFDRQNLTYFVFNEEDKYSRLIRIIETVKGCGIIYVRNRRQTKELALFLNKKKISATYYHAGLKPDERDRKQNEWMKEDKRVIVATNAFGMGIDKPNVRFVIHFDLPESIEAYFQEAGRAGRDEKQAFAVLLFEKADTLNARHHHEASFPPVKQIRSTYNALGNFLQIPIGNGMDQTFNFDISGFSEQYNFQHIVVYNALRILEKEGFLKMNEGLHAPSRLYIKTDKETLYRFQVENPGYDPIIKLILRSYSGIFSEFSQINEQEMARRLNLPTHKIVEMLTRLEKQQLLDYVPAAESPTITFTENRVEIKDLTLSKENYGNRIQEAEKRMEAVIRYTESKHRCRTQWLLAYFGESDTKRCGKCDVCIERNKLDLNELEFDTIIGRLKPLLTEKPEPLDAIMTISEGIPEDKVIRALRWLTDNGKIGVNDEGLYFWI
ncbi:MAG: RecQ family ATP-dependent DNA helicase, partial [Bacteroidota bacterium]